MNDKLYPVLHKQTKKCLLIHREKLPFKIILRYFGISNVNFMIESIKCSKIASDQYRWTCPSS